VPPGVSFNERALIVGKTQSGKTTLARKLAAGFTGARLVVNDPKGMLDFGVPIVRDPARLDPAARLVHYVPVTLARGAPARGAREPTGYERFFRDVWHMLGPTVLWDDEAAAWSTGNYAPEHSDVYQQQGGGKGKGRLVLTQRPVDIRPNLRTEAEHVFVFTPPPAWPDLRVLALEFGRDPGELQRFLRDLASHEGPHSFVWWHRGTGELTACAPLDPGWVTAPLAA
jgi:hypothetical protein